MNIQHIDNITQMLTDSVFAYGAHDFITRHLPNAKDDSIFQYVYAHQGKELVARFKKYGKALVCIFF